ncbi:MAG: AEC family transporter, partial [Oscillospiraceae bacterium]
MELSNIALSFNAVFPVLFLVVTGIILKTKGVITDGFSTTASRLTYTVAFPMSVYREISLLDFSNPVSSEFYIYCILSVIIPVIFLCFVVPHYVKDEARAGAFIQSSYRTNFLLIGLPIASSVFSPTEMIPIVMATAISIPLYNVMSVFVFSKFGGSEKKANICSIILSIVKIPILWGVFLGMFVNLGNIVLPPFLDKYIGYLAACAMPLALIALGAQFCFKDLYRDIKPISCAVFIKLLLLPVLGTIPMILMGFAGNEVAAIFFMLGSPVAVSSYAMAQSMHSDYKFLGEVITATSILSSITLFFG